MTRAWRRISVFCLALAALSSPPASAQSPPEAPALDFGAPWPRHAIDDRYDGPDGTKLADVNGDGRLDVVTGWESEGLTVIYFHPGAAYVRRSWPSVVVGSTRKAEDAVFVDLNRDGNADVVTSCEQHMEKVLVNWAPAEKERLLVPQAWRQEEFPAATGVSQWMFAEPIALNGPDQPLALVIGGKNYEHNQTATLGLLLPGTDPARVADYRWQPLTNVSWVMSIVTLDMNGDQQPDILYSDKHGPGCGAWWLENPGPGKTASEWPRHELTSGLDGAMLLCVSDVDRDGWQDVVVPVDHFPVGDKPKERRLRFLRRMSADGLQWSTHDVRIAPRSGQPKAVTAGDVNGDGRVDLVVTSTGATDGQMGCYWLEYANSPIEESWEVHRIAGPQGIKYDLVHLLDLDGDDDLDVLTNEEKQDEKGLGVFWYENPLRSRPALAAGS